MGRKSAPDFSTVTETPNNRATSDQLQILFTRYHLASRLAVGKDVLEVAAGAGMGLGLIARNARRTVGGDLDERNCAIARSTYEGRGDVEIQRFNAEVLPFSDSIFDLVIIFEALYYIERIDLFLKEAKRVLRPGGVLLISTVNCRWAEFNPSPFSVEYLSARQLADVLSGHGFRVEVLGGFPQRTGGIVRGLISVIRRMAVRLHLIPNTMKGKELLKRAFYGRLSPIPAELLPDSASPAKLDKLASPYSADQYRFVYAIGTVLK